MKAISKIIEISNPKKITTEYIETELQQRNIIPLRWSVVKIDKVSIFLNVTLLSV